MQSESAEKALIFRILLEPELMGEAKGLTPDDFSLPDMGKVFSVFQKRSAANESLDSVLVEAESGVTIDVLELSPASSAPIEQYVAAIKRASEGRRVGAVLDQAKAQLASASSDPLDTLTRAIESITSERKFSGLRRSSEVVRNYRTEFTGRAGATAGITYGITGLDSTLLPMRPGRLVVLASRPGIGKTALAETISDHAASLGKGPVLFVSLEMKAEELTDRAMARMSGLSAQDIMRGNTAISELEPHLIARSDTPIIYVDEGGSTVADIALAGQKVKMTHKNELGLIVVDYLQLVGDKGADNEVYRVGAISHGLKRLAMKLECPVIAMAQLNRNIEAEKRKPRLSDLRDSGAIEQDADVVVIMNGVPWEQERTLFILKQRQGQTGEVKLLFDGDKQRWESEPVAAHAW